MRSRTRVLSFARPVYSAAAMPAGPAPTMTTSHSSAAVPFWVMKIAFLALPEYTDATCNHPLGGGYSRWLTRTVEKLAEAPTWPPAARKLGWVWRGRLRASAAGCAPRHRAWDRVLAAGPGQLSWCARCRRMRWSRATGQRARRCAGTADALSHRKFGHGRLPGYTASQSRIARRSVMRL